MRTSNNSIKNKYVDEVKVNNITVDKFLEHNLLD